MEHAIKLITENWAVIAPVVLLILSEYLAMNPKAKSNSLVQLILSLLSRKAK